MTEALNFNENNTPLLMFPDEEISNDALYANNVASLLGDESVNDIRRRQFEEAEEDILQATVKNISRPDMDAQTRSFAEAYAYENYALSLFEKYRKDSDVMNKEVADRVNGKLFEENPQTFLNALTDTPEDFEDVGMFDNRIYDLNYSLSQRIEDPKFDTVLYGRIARDMGLNVAGNLLLKGKGGAVKKLSGKLLSSYGLGHYIDWGMLGEKTIYEAQQIAYQLKLDAIGASDEEYPQKKEAFIQFIEDIPEAYRGDILQGIEEGPSIYADAGGAATAYGLQAYARSLKAYGHLFGKAKNLKAWEKITKGFGRKSAPATAVEDVEDVAEAIDARKSTALVPYVDHPLTVISEGVNNRTLSLAPPENPTILLPDGRRVTYLLPPEERLRLSKPVEYDKIEPATTKRLTWEGENRINPRTIGTNSEMTNQRVGTREWLPEVRRIRYTYDYGGRGWRSLDEAVRTARNIQKTVYKTLKLAKNHKMFQNVEGDLIHTGSVPHEDIQVSAASRNLFGRAAYTEKTMGTGETGAHYGPGSYMSREEVLSSPASRGWYSPLFELQNWETNYNNVVDSLSSKYPNADVTHVKTVFKHINKTEKEASVQGLTDFYSALKEIYKNTKNLKPTIESNIETIKLLNDSLKDMMEIYSKKKTNIINSWMKKEIGPEHEIDQSYARGGQTHLFHDQHPKIQKALLKIEEKLTTAMTYIYDELRDNPDNISAWVNNMAFSSMFPKENSLIRSLPDVRHSEVLSDLTPYYVRIRFSELTLKDLEAFGINEDTVLTLPVTKLTKEQEELKTYINKQALLSFKDDLVKNGIWAAAQSDTNYVVFKDTAGTYSNVFRQEYNLKGEHVQKVLDNGYVIRYDPNIQGYVIDYYMTTPGRGRKPVIIHKQPLKEYDPKKNKDSK